jgi:hypothetical protein
MAAARLVTWADRDGHASAQNILDCQKPGFSRLRADPGGGGPLRLALLSFQLSAIVRVPEWVPHAESCSVCSRVSLRWVVRRKRRRKPLQEAKSEPKGERFTTVASTCSVFPECH